MGNVMQVSSDQFDAEVLKAAGLVLVDFYATWCGPCRMIAPVLEDLAGKFSGRAKIVKVDVDGAAELAAQYSVSGVPTLLFFKDGKVVDRHVGFAPAGTLTAKLDKLAGPA